MIVVADNLFPRPRSNSVGRCCRKSSRGDVSVIPSLRLGHTLVADLDYEVPGQSLPPNVLPAYDMRLTAERAD
jgi:hypothetical protein